MRCKFCGSTAIHADTQHQNFSKGKAVAGAVAFGVVGAAAGFIGKEKKGYRCGACGSFMDAPMDVVTEMTIDRAVRDAESGRDRSMYDYYKKQYANIQANIPAPQPAAAPQPERMLSSGPAMIPVSPAASPEGTESGKTVKIRYRSGSWDPAAPVYIRDIIVTESPQGDLLSLRIYNQAPAALRSLYLHAYAYDDTGDPCGDVTCVYQGMQVEQGGLLPEDKEFALGTSVAYRVEIKLEKASFTNNDVWRADGSSEALLLEEQIPLTPDNFPRLKFLRSSLKNAAPVISERELFLPIDHGTWRQCVCGHPALSGSPCSYCHLTAEALPELLSQKRLQQVQQETVKKKAERRYLAAYPVYEGVLNKDKDAAYSKAAALLKENTSDSVAKAAEVFRGLEGWKDSADKAKACEEMIPSLLEKEAREAEERRKREEEEKRRLEKEHEEQLRREKEEAAKAAKTRNLIIVIFVIIALIAAAAAFYFKTVVPKQRYNEARELMQSGSYKEAADIFIGLGEYNDSSAMVKLCAKYSTYSAGLRLMEEGQYAAAREVFTGLSGFSDADEKREECVDLRAAKLYSDAEEMAAEGNKVAAWYTLQAIDHFNGTNISSETVKAKMKELKEDTPQLSLQAGDVVTFGSFEQDGLGNGTEPLRWKILDVQAGKALVLSESALHIMAYDEGGSADYAHSDIRNWLTGDGFLFSAFTAEERKYLTSGTTVLYPTSPSSLLDEEALSNYWRVDEARKEGEEILAAAEGPFELAKVQAGTAAAAAETQSPAPEGLGSQGSDSVFLLTQDEVNGYLPKAEDRIAPYTQAARKEQAWGDPDEPNNAAWWLSDIASYAKDTIRVVLPKGTITLDGVSCKNDGGDAMYNRKPLYCAVRPAMWVRLEGLSAPVEGAAASGAAASSAEGRPPYSSGDPANYTVSPATDVHWTDTFDMAWSFGSLPDGTLQHEYAYVIHDAATDQPVSAGFGHGNMSPSGSSVSLWISSLALDNMTDGEYYFEVFAIDRDTMTQISESVRSEAKFFDKAEERLPAPTDLSLQGTVASWTVDKDYSGYSMHFRIEKQAEDGSFQKVHETTRSYTNPVDFKNYGMTEPGTYRFKISLSSPDPQVVLPSEYSEYSNESTI